MSAVRLIQAVLPAGTRESVADALTDEEVNFAFAGETSGREYTDLLFVPAETDDVEGIIEMLRDAGVPEEGYVVVSETEAVVSDRPVESSEEGDEKVRPGHQISREELHSAMAEELRTPAEYVIFTALSAVFATAGLLLDSATVVTGSMVVSPILGPAVASSVGTVVGDEGLVREGFKTQVGGAAVAIVSATGFALLSRVVFAPKHGITSLGQVSQFSSPVALTLAIALVAGVAGALSLTSGANTALVGVAVAAALVPPSAVVGLGIAYGEVELAVGAGVLVLVNLFSINLMSLVTFRAAGYRPDSWFEREQVRELFTRRVLAPALGVLVVSSVVGAATLQQRQNAGFERDVRHITDRTDARLLSVDVRYESTILFRQPRMVVVRVGENPPGFAGHLHDRIRRRTGENVEVVVYEATGVAGRNRSSLHEPHPSASNRKTVHQSSAVRPRFYNVRFGSVGGRSGSSAGGAVSSSPRRLLDVTARHSLVER